MEFKTCTRCKEAKETPLFPKRKTARDGLDSWCKACRRSHEKAWVSEHREQQNQRITAWKKANKERYREYMRPIWRVHRTERRITFRTRSKEIYKAEIQEIYRDCPPGFHVDHIVPLKGKTVSGLHVPWNLQYLPAEENLRKSNRF